MKVVINDNLEQLLIIEERDLLIIYPPSGRCRLHDMCWVPSTFDGDIEISPPQLVDYLKTHGRTVRWLLDKIAQQAAE